MKSVIINGSARKGNTLTAIQAFTEGVAEVNEVEIIAPEKLTIAPCKGCGVCQCSKGCVDQDDTNPTIDKIVAADVIIFATPVYWWGMSAQLKLIIDKRIAAPKRLLAKRKIQWRTCLIAAPHTETQSIASNLSPAAFLFSPATSLNDNIAQKSPLKSL